MKVGIIGAGGVVGTAMRTLFPEAVCYDKGNGFVLSWYSKLTEKVEQRATTMEDVNTADVAFVCVPTPHLEGKGLDMSIIEEVIKECSCPLIIVRSTMMPGTADRLEKKYGKNIVVQPEYLGETVSHPLSEESDRKFIILGGRKENTRKAIELYQEAYNANISIRQVSALEAEVIKLSENRAIAFKVAECQELYDACEASGVDYYTVRDAVYGDDPRFNLWWTFVFPEKRGFNSKCIPKDIYGWEAWAKEVGLEPELTSALLKYNQKLLDSNKKED